MYIIKKLSTNLQQCQAWEEINLQEVIFKEVEQLNKHQGQ